MTAINASFEVTNWKEEPFDEQPDTARLTTAAVTKSYSGDIDGESTTEWLMAYGEDGTASFVGIERIAGTVSGRQGTIVVQHVGSYENGVATAALMVLAGCGTADLAGTTGQGDFVADPSGKVRLELSFS